MFKPKKLNDQGLVSMLVTMILIIVISLIVVGFARLSRREQRQSLDAQLSSQAFYAAESGVNDAIAAIESTPGLIDPAKDYSQDCNGPTSFMKDAGILSTNANQLDGTNIQYSCLLVDNSPETLEFSAIIPGESKAVELNTNGTPMSTIQISWRPADPTNHNQVSCTATGPSLPATWPVNCKQGILRFDVFKYTGGSSGIKYVDYKNEDIFTAFAYPSTSGSNSVTLASGTGLANQGINMNGTCDNSTGECVVRVTNVSSDSVFLRLGALYNPISVSVSALDSTSAPLQLFDGQISIDVTGKASDVLRRIVVRVPYSWIGDFFPSEALQSNEGICKRYLVAGPDTSIDGAGVSDGNCTLSPIP